MAVEAAFTAVACLAVPSAPAVARVLAFPAALTLAEAARTRWPFGGLPIGGVFLGQAGGPVSGLARVGGPLGITLAVYLGGAGLAALAEATAVAGRDGSRARRFARVDTGDQADRMGALSGALAGIGPRVAAGCAALLLTVAAVAAADHAPDGGAPVGSVAGAAVQGGGARGFRKSQIDPAVVLAAQQDETRLLRQRDQGAAPNLVLWPEDVVSLPGPLDRSPEEAVLADLARTLRATLVVGVTETIAPTAFRNEIVAWGPDGTLVARFEKVHRVPFGEYVPYRSFFAHLGNLSAVPLDAVPGTGSGLLDTPAAPLGTLVSYEVFYADRGRASVRDGAELLIVPTNTSSYASAQVPTQEIAAVRDPGRRNRVATSCRPRPPATARPSPTGAPCSDGRSSGHPRSSRPPWRDAVGWTIYVRYGDTPPLLLAGLALIAGWVVAGRHRRRAR